MKELNPKHSGQLAGSADDVVLLEKLHGAAHTAHVVVHHLPPKTCTHQHNHSNTVVLLTFTKC